jgi:hypothetical protein
MSKCGIRKKLIRNVASMIMRFNPQKVAVAIKGRIADGQSLTESEPRRPPIKFNKRILEIRGNIIDHFDGISTRLETQVDRGLPGGRGFVQSLRKEICCINDDEMARAIAQCIRIDGIDFDPV